MSKASIFSDWNWVTIQVSCVTVINCCSEEKLSVPFEFEFVLPDGNMELLLSGKIENCKEVVSEKGNMEDILEVETVARFPIDHSLKALYVDEVSCGQKRSFQSVPKGSQEVDLLNRRGAP